MSDPRRPRASDFQPEVLGRFDPYVHGLINRRGFLAGAARFAAAQQVPPDDPRLATSHVEFKSAKGRMGAFGFCHGGGIANFLATRLPDIAAAAPF